MESASQKIIMKTLDHNTNIGIIAGGGDAPSVLINRLKKEKINFFILAIDGNASKSILKNNIHEVVNFGELKKALKFFKENKVTHISFIGSIKRPSISSLKLDSEAAFLVAKLGFNKFVGGDNKLLSSLLSFFEKKGYTILGAEEIVPELIAQKGVLGKIKPSKIDKMDIDLGIKILQTMSTFDIGQSVVIEKGYVLGLEAAEGTNNLIKRCKSLKKETGNSGVLIKMKKMNQDSRIDLPSIGVHTIEEIKKSGFSGIAIKSNESFIIDVEKVIQKADQYNIFLVGI